MRKNLAFTLLEILVVIGIISILVGVVSISYSSSQKKARDLRRKSDLRALQNCLEQAFPILNVYPPISANSGVLSADCDGVTGSSQVTISDPVGTSAYSRTQSADFMQYTVSATLEVSGSSISVNQLQ